MPAVISDTSCLIFLGKIGQLDLLPHLFGEIWLAPAVATEYRLPLPAWVRLQATHSLPTAEQVPERFGPGERASIGLALDLADCLLILDDEQPKQLAKQLGIRCIGTLGVVKLAKETGLLPAVRPVPDELQAAGMWLADAVVARVCREAGE